MNIINYKTLNQIVAGAAIASVLVLRGCSDNSNNVNQSQTYVKTDQGVVQKVFKKNR